LTGTECDFQRGHLLRTAISRAGSGGIAADVLGFPKRSCVIDSELIAAGRTVRPTSRIRAVCRIDPVRGQAEGQYVEVEGVRYCARLFERDREAGAEVTDIGGCVVLQRILHGFCRSSPRARQSPPNR
jgi:hypothetical protein